MDKLFIFYYLCLNFGQFSFKSNTGFVTLSKFNNTNNNSLLEKKSDTSPLAG